MGRHARDSSRLLNRTDSDSVSRSTFSRVFVTRARAFLYTRVGRTNFERASCSADLTFYFYNVARAPYVVITFATRSTSGQQRARAFRQLCVYYRSRISSIFFSEGVLLRFPHFPRDLSYRTIILRTSGTTRARISNNY